jgi:hypothetical protein
MPRSMRDLLGELPKLTSEERAGIVQRVDELNVAEGRFRYRAEEYDVIDQERLRRFRVEKLNWLFWLHDDEHHSIFKQVASLLWDYALFLTVNGLRVKASNTKPPVVRFNAPMLLLLDSGFVAKQAMSIRGLVDKRDDVISLKRLVNDIKKNRAVITREVFVAQDGLPYDYAVGKDADYAKKLKEVESPWFDGVETTGPNAWRVSERSHEMFDKLSGTSGSHRNRDDLLPVQWFDDLNGKFGVCGDLQNFANKFIAHAADSGSRSDSSAAQKTVTLEKLKKCHQSIVAVANRVSQWILGDGSSWTVPQPQFDPVESLDKGWISEGALEEGRELWNQHVAAIAQWSA